MNAKPVIISGKEVLPIVEGGKGVAVSNGLTSGAFARAGAVGTFSGVNADFYDENNNHILQIYHTHTRRERHEELIQMAIKGGVEQARIAYENSNNDGRIHMNILWEMGGAESILHGVLEKAHKLIHGITCGAGMPYKLAEIAAQYNIFYHPIVSSMRAFKILWKRAYQKIPDLLSSVVYEDPWLAGGHNGLSTNESPDQPQNPFPRVAELRKFMNEIGLNHIPIIMAGGVWRLDEWSDWLDNPEIGPIAFQFGTRPLLTAESPIPKKWKEHLMTLKPGDVFLNKFSPTGFYSSAVNNRFIKNLRARSERQITHATNPTEECNTALTYGPRSRILYTRYEDAQKARTWLAQGFTEILKTPDETIVFVTPEEAQNIKQDQVNCMGCLSACAFSNWLEDAEKNYTTGLKPDPRSFCIQKTLQDIAHGGDIEDNLMFAGHNAYRFGTDEFYVNAYQKGINPTVGQLVETIMQGR